MAIKLILVRKLDSIRILLNDISNHKIKLMPIPDYQSLMLRVLKTIGDGEEHEIKDIIKLLSDS